MADPASRSGTTYLHRDLLAYIARVHVPHDNPLAQAFAAPEGHGLPAIQVGPSEGKLLAMLARLAGAKWAVEIGTLTAYSAIHLARGLGPDGHLYTVEHNPVAARVARANLAAASLAGRVDVIEGDALSVLSALTRNGPFDLVFIDADKERYDQYGRWAVANLRPGGLLLGDNAFYFGRLLDPDDAAAAAMRRFHEDVALHCDTVCIPTPDGLLLGVKR